MPSVLANLNLNQNEIQNAIAQVLSSSASVASPKKGQFYFDDTSKLFTFYNGSAWVGASGATISYGSPVGSAVGDTANDGVATTVARSDHRHAREAFGAVTAVTGFGQGSATGGAATVAHSDHFHGTPTHDAAAHSAIPLSALATATANLNLGGFQATNGADPTTATALATKQYVDNARAGLSVKDPALLATAAALPAYTAAAQTLTATANAALTVDGTAVAVGNRILVKNGAAGADNGIYTVTATGSAGAPWVLTRATDGDGSGEITDGTAVWVQSGTANANQRWVCTVSGATPWVPGTTSTTWTMDFQATSATAGSGLSATGGTLNVGAGTGIAVGADTISVDRSTNGATVPLKYSQAVGDGVATSIVVTHNLGTQDVHVALYASGTPFGEVMPDIQHTSVNTVTLVFATAPAAGAYRVVVIG